LLILILSQNQEVSMT